MQGHVPGWCITSLNNQNALLMKTPLCTSFQNDIFMYIVIKLPLNMFIVAIILEIIIIPDGIKYVILRVSYISNCSKILGEPATVMCFHTAPLYM